jgi:transcriptional regulator with PAS, ATPase and Fis domain
MEKKSSDLNIHQKLELVIKEMVDRELSLKDVLREFEKIFFEQTARKYEGNKTKMAKALGIHRNTLQNRAKALKIKKKY